MKKILLILLLCLSVVWTSCVVYAGNPAKSGAAQRLVQGPALGGARGYCICASQASFGARGYRICASQASFGARRRP